MRFWHFAKNHIFGILPKTKAHFWHFPTLVFLGKKGGIYEEKELQRSKGFKTSMRRKIRKQNLDISKEQMEYMQKNLKLDAVKIAKMHTKRQKGVIISL